MGNLHFGRCHHLRSSAGTVGMPPFVCSGGVLHFFGGGSTAAWGNIGHAQSLGWYAFSQSCQIAKPHFGFANGLSSPCLPGRLHALSPLCENEILGVLLVLRLAHSPLFAELSNEDNRPGPIVFVSLRFYCRPCICFLSAPAISLASSPTGFW